MGLLMLGTFWFWIMLAITAIFITYFIEAKEGSGWSALIALIIFGVLLYFFGAKDAILGGLSYVVQHPLHIVLGFSLYFVVGALWSIVKWYFFLRRKVRELERSSDWNFDENDVLKEGREPKARYYRSTIMMWISWWPFSALWTLLNDPLRHIVEWITDTMEKTFDDISSKMFKGLKRRR